MNRCPTCGTTYADNSKFCTKDGAKLIPVGGPNPMTVSGPRPTAAAVRPELKPTPAHANLVGQVLDKRYKIERKLGEGGMGEVYRAHDTRLGRDVALKTLPADVREDPDLLKRFRQEARILAALHQVKLQEAA